MREIKSFGFYTVYFVKYVQKYWVINTAEDVLEAVPDSLPEALAVAEAFNNSLAKFIMENDAND